MIIACEQCETRFQLDETRIPAKGARVRCSRCKHAFFVRRPGVAEADALDEVVAEATGPGASSAPPAARDLHAAVGRDESESDWEFNDEAARAAPPPPAAAGSPAPRPAAPPPEPGGVGAETSDVAGGLGDEDLDALGDPEEWNLLADAPPSGVPADVDVDADDGADADPLEELLGTGSRSEAPEPRAPQPREAAADVEAAPVAEVAARPEAAQRRPVGMAALGAAAAGLGWAAAIGLIGLAARALLVGALEPPVAPRAAPRSVALAGLGTAHDVRATRLENALAGPILVVSGRLETRAAAAGRAVEVQLMGPDGAPLPGATGWAGPPLSELQLRELAPEELREALAQGAPTLAARGGGTFHAVFAEVPTAAADVSLRARPLPSTSPPATAPPPTDPPSSE